MAQRHDGSRPGVLMALCLAVALLLPGGALAQATARAEAVAQPGDLVVTGISPGSTVSLRAGPANAFPAVADVRHGQVLRGLGCANHITGRWCEVETREARPRRGFLKDDFVTEAVLRPPPEDPAGGPDYYAVRGLPPGDRLNVRREPSALSPALATLREGEVVQNLGCRTTGGARWCRIRSTEGIDVTGWVAGRFLRESGPPRPPPGGGDIFVVAGLPAGDRLNLRAEPSTRGRILATLGPGERVRNLGCRSSGSTRWCQVRTLGGVEVTGWASGRYLRGG
ncbi:MAG: SH3 domain-containing protein [Paracoccaceae bacterium]|nr:MAG: SH3 domain-containing protein [Paracoccaceae bacterium]